MRNIFLTRESSKKSKIPRETSVSRNGVRWIQLGTAVAAGVTAVNESCRSFFPAGETKHNRPCRATLPPSLSVVISAPLTKPTPPRVPHVARSRAHASVLCRQRSGPRNSDFGSSTRWKSENGAYKLYMRFIVFDYHRTTE